MIRLLIVAFIAVTALIAEDDAALNTVDQKLQEIREIRKLDAGILEDIRDPFYYNKNAAQSTGISNSGSRFVAIVGNKVRLKTGEWVGKGSKLGQQFIIKSVDKDQIVLEDDFGNEVIEKLYGENDNVKISFK